MLPFPIRVKASAVPLSRASLILTPLLTPAALATWVLLAPGTLPAEEFCPCCSAAWPRAALLPSVIQAATRPSASYQESVRISSVHPFLINLLQGALSPFPKGLARSLPPLPHATLPCHIYSKCFMLLILIVSSLCQVGVVCVCLYVRVCVCFVEQFLTLAYVK